MGDRNMVYTLESRCILECLCGFRWIFLVLNLNAKNKCKIMTLPVFGFAVKSKHSVRKCFIKPEFLLAL